MGRGSNYGLGARDMGRAASYAMQNAARVGDVSFTTAVDVAQRFEQFAEYAKEMGLRRFEEVSRENVTAYGRELADRVENRELSSSYAQNLVSAVNTVLSSASRGQWESVSPTREAGIPCRSGVRETPAGSSDRRMYERAREVLSERGRVISDMARVIGMRSKEAALINARQALKEARAQGAITVSDGTKGGRPRTLELSERRIATLERAAAIQGNDKSMIPSDQTWKEFRAGELRDTRETLQDYGMTGLHDLRAGYAADRYQELTGHRPPVEGGQAPRDLDRSAREQIAAELGHGRIDVTTSYLGGQA